MRKKYDISSFTILSVALGLYGIYMIIVGIISLFWDFNAKDLKDISSQTLRSRQFVQGYVSDCVRKPVGSDGMIGEFGSSSSGFSGFSGYTIPLQNGEYIRFWVSDKKTKETLEKMVSGENVAFALQGYVAKYNGSDTTWYQEIPDFDESKLILNYVIWESSRLRDTRKILSGAFICLISFLLIRFVFKIEVRRVNETSLNLEHYDIYQLKMELKLAKERMSKVEQEDKMKTNAVRVGWILVILGIVYCLIVKVLPVIGLMSITCGIIKIWTGFINSEHPKAMEIADKWKISTVQNRKDVYGDFISQLEEALQKKMNHK